MRWLWRRGITPKQTLIAADELGADGAPAGTVRIAGGHEAVCAVLEDQVARRRNRELPIVGDDPSGCSWSRASTRCSSAYTNRS